MSDTERLLPLRYGAKELSDPQFELIYLASQIGVGRWMLFAADRQEIEIRVTPRGFLRVSKIRKRGAISASGVCEKTLKRAGYRR